MDSRKLYEFYHEADVVESWIAERMVIAASEDYGQDLEHVEVSTLNQYCNYLRGFSS